MAPVQPVGPIVRLIGHVLFVVWCAIIVVAIAAVGLLHLGRLAGLGRGSEPFPTAT